MLRTMRKKHIDYFPAINSLLDAVYFYNEQDYEELLRALKDGSLSSANTKFTEDEILDMKAMKTFRQRYNKYLRKEIRQPHSMRESEDG
jgi:hypothetical protein